MFLLLMYCSLTWRGQLQLLRGDEHEADAGIAAHGGHQEWTVRPNFRSPHRPMVRSSKRPFLPVDGQQIRQGLGGVVVATVSGVDDGYQ